MVELGSKCQEHLLVIQTEYELISGTLCMLNSIQLENRQFHVFLVSFDERLTNNTHRMHKLFKST